MRNYILSMFDSRNDRSDFYFSAPESIEFPSCRFERNTLKSILVKMNAGRMSRNFLKTLMSFQLVFSVGRKNI